MNQVPNILFIVADDLNAWIGALGRSPDVRTPNIDALAGRGTMFTRAYCPAPYCNASRMSFFTGLLPSSTGIYEGESYWTQPARPPTFIELLRSAGYYTFGAGKVFHGKFMYGKANRKGLASAQWRDTSNNLEIWDEFVPNTAEPLPVQRPLNGLFDFSDIDSVPSKYHLFDWGPIPANAEDDLPDVRVCHSVSAFLADPPKTPFFCAAGIYKPHLPWHVPQRFFDLYPPEKLSLPLVKQDDLDDVPDIARKWALSPPDHELVCANDQWRPAVQGYLASISYCDWIVGRILDALEQSPAANNTVVILCGDNGFHLGEKLHWRKFALWEEATRVPLVVAGPPAGTMAARVDAPVSLVDIFPTLMDLCQVDAPERLDGESLLPLIRDSARGKRGPAISTWGRGNHSIRHGKWRYTHYVDATEELYDQAADPYEWTNLAGDARFDRVKRKLIRALPSDAPIPTS